jgi:hypothetical protein
MALPDAFRWRDAADAPEAVLSPEALERLAIKWESYDASQRRVVECGREVIG